MAVTTTYAWTEVLAPAFLNTTTAGDPEDVELVAFGDGTWRAFWQAADATGLRVRAMGEDGLPLGNDTNQISGGGTHEDVAAAWLTGTGLAVAVHTHRWPGDDSQIEIMFAGVGPLTPFTIGDTSVDDYEAAVSAMVGGGFVITYTREFAVGDEDIHFALYDANAQLVTDGAVEFSGAVSTHSAVAGLAGGGFVVVWQQTPSGGGDEEMMMRRYSAAGAPLGAAVIIDTAGSTNREPEILALPDGGYVVAYTDNGWGLDGTEITARVYNADGSVRSGFIRVNQVDTDGDQSEVSLTLLSNGFWAVSWMEGVTMRAQAFNASGARIGGEISTGASLDGDLLGLTDGRMVMARRSTFPDDDGDSVRYSIQELRRTSTGDGAIDVIVGDGLVDLANGGGGDDQIYGYGADDVLNGGENNDSLNGHNGDDHLIGGAGNDLLDGGAGADLMDGGQGDDTYYLNDVGDEIIDFGGLDNVFSLVTYSLVGGGLEHLTLMGSDDIDATGNQGGNILTGNGGDNILTGGLSIDTLIGGAGDDVLDGGDHNDSMNGGDGVDVATYDGADAGVTVNLTTGIGSGSQHSNGDTLAGIENLIGSAFDDILTGEAGVNSLWGGDGADTLSGMAGDDLLVGGNGADVLSGGDGIDTADYSASATGVSVNLVTGVGVGGTAAGDSFSGVENLIGSAHADGLTGGAGANRLEGGDANDLLTGGGGDDRLIGGDGDDELLGGSGDDDLSGGEGLDTLSGGAGDDDLTGGAADDVLLGAAGADILTGAAGADLLQGGEDADELDGGADDDVLNGGAGADLLFGGSGVDTATYYGATVAVTVNLATGTGAGGWAEGDTYIDIEYVFGSNKGDTITGDAAANLLNGGGGDDILDGGAEVDVLLGSGGHDLLKGGDGMDDLSGGTGDDTLQGAADNDSLNGGAGEDLLQGGNGDDALQGGSEDDVLQGGAGADKLNGGSGDDHLNGGSGADVFDFGAGWGQDTIADFSAGMGAGDVIAFVDTVFADFSALMAATADDGLGNCVITKGVNTLKLTGVTKAQLHADDFLFVAPASPVQTKEANALTLPDLDGPDPLVLPDDGPPPGEQAWSDLLDLGLSSFDGRDPHRAIHSQEPVWFL